MTVNLSNIKTQLKAVLDTANTTTAAFDLSTGLSTRVQKVLKVHPGLIPQQASFYPWVTTFVDKKEVEHATIAKDQITAKRMGTVTMKVVGGVWEPTVSDVTADAADEAIEKLMENVEEVVRRSFKLNNAVQWTKTEDVSYYAWPVKEDTHLRFGVLTLTAKVDY